MNYTIPSGTINPYTQPLEWCGIAETVVQQHYQTQLSTWWGIFLLGGVVIGLLVGFALTLWWMNRSTSDQTLDQEDNLD